MKKIFAFTAALAIMAVFALTVIGCPQPTTSGSSGNNAETWTYVTSFSQVNGSWKAPSSAYNSYNNGISATIVFSDYTITFNASAKTISATGVIYRDLFRRRYRNILAKY